MAEHWSLIVAPRSEADAKKFERGDFQSVTMNEAALRLDKTVGSPLTPPTLVRFKALAAHRNKMVHFFHPDAHANAEQTSKIAAEQLRAWYSLNRLLETDWKEAFEGWEEQVAEISVQLRSHHDYLKVRFDEVKARIDVFKKSGVRIVECSMCGYESSAVKPVLGDLVEHECLVCESHERMLPVACPQCDAPIEFLGQVLGACPKCHTTFEPETLAGELNEEEHDPRDGDPPHTPAHCLRCENTDSVILFKGKGLCLGCFAIYEPDVFECCHYCDAPYAASMEDSFLTGCLLCDGRFGDLKDD